MHTVGSRASACLGFIFNATTALIAMVGLVGFLLQRSPPNSEFKVLKYQPYMTLTSQSFTFIPNIDLKEEFNPNLKQIFFYVKVVFGKNKENSEMIWSKIVTRKDEKKFFEAIKSNYRLSNLESYETLDFELRGCYFPYVGMIRDICFKTFIFDQK
ncbi:putative signal peptidase [Hamiltosporidium magnivora]|uniref:Signal peptidase complex subunit 3 n=1 Tax=Hamiltosporidium magnivora TaxID=148818 RepID=A0A4Q9KRJ2_9MICR|nr:putative signal peptidase [Hamiltosporidium magnivora]